MDQAPREQAGLQDQWWERHFRGFEAGLPIKLICNLQLLFDDEVEENKSVENEKIIEFIKEQDENQSD